MTLIDYIIFAIIVIAACLIGIAIAYYFGVKDEELLDFGYFEENY